MQYAYADVSVDVRTRNAGLTLTTDQRNCAARAVIIGATPSQREAMLEGQIDVMTTDNQNRLTALAFAQCVPSASLLTLIKASFERQRVIHADCTAQRTVDSPLPHSTLWFSLFTSLPPDLSGPYTAALRAAQRAC